MALGSTQPLVKMSTSNIPGGKDGQCMRLITSPPSCAECHDIWEPESSGTLWATLAVTGPLHLFIFRLIWCVHPALVLHILL